MLVDNRFDITSITGSEMSISELVDFLNKSKEFHEIFMQNESSIAMLVKFKLFSKALTGDFNCMRFVLDKVFRQELQEVEDLFFAEIPVVRNGQTTGEFKELSV
jgi:hypothetical protein